ncbi:hypothetical protein PFICI_07285 [Pestalotiopsis fici W106-1]|uniref:Helicase ATP-binding domain-containing protein n=1 Tax=Pestalotiopsis fici (strain W106-1 / CGMCC3.15140) TaxID=1229662 RepID=W3X847_PESFW|nr:uncharacterized protein PFICI_07285 [Pestalotiopsis fici W106-1]ETS82283.1 hypothetical protein PFICI_07285 [Pestalotiopsis fici W106-1]
MTSNAGQVNTAPTYRKQHGFGPEWRVALDEFFKSQPGSVVQENYWEPRSMSSSISHEQLRRFFNGHDMPFGKDKLLYREKFALWAIDEALKEYPSGIVDPAGDIFQGKFVSHHGDKGNRPASEWYENTNCTNGQGGFEYKNSNSTTKERGDTEPLQSLYGAAQALHYASPNCLGPPVGPAATYLQMEKVGTHGQSSLSLYNSPLFPEVKYENDASANRFKGMATSGPASDRWAELFAVGTPQAELRRPKQTKGFLDSQVTGIVWILSRLLGELPQLKRLENAREREIRRKLRGPKYGGAILADSMGLGKTLTAIATIELMASHSLNVDHDEKTGMRVYRPILILVPNLAVAGQWTEEILLNTSSKSIQRILVAGGDACLFSQDPRVSHLPIDSFKVWPHRYKDVWDTDSPTAARTIIISPIDTWAKRTLYTKEESSREDGEDCDKEGDKGSKKDKPKKSWHSILTAEGRGFSMVCVDEAHKVKSTSTNVHKSVSLLERQFTLLITATPCTNSLGDLRGLVELLWSSALKQVNKSDVTREAHQDIETLPQLKEAIQGRPLYDDMQLLAGCPDLLSPLLRPYASGLDPDIVSTRTFLRFFESLAMLKRGPGSFLFEDFEQTRRIPLEGLYPGVKSRTVNIEFDPSTATAYESKHLELLIWCLHSLNYWSSEAEDDIDKPSEDSEDCPRTGQVHRKWQIACSSMDVFKLETLFDANGYGPRTKPVLLMRNAGVTFIKLADFLLDADEPAPKTALDYLKLAIRGSPTLRYILYDLKEHVLSKRIGKKIKKVLITEDVPMLAYYYELVLQLIGINCRVLHSELSPSQRKELIADFNNGAMDSVQVLIQMYKVGFAGTNLQKNCSRVIVAAQAQSLAVQWQAAHRVIRVGQTQVVDVVRVKVLNSYYAFRESQQVAKILPELSVRAQGTMSHILVQLLNNFQYEIDELWNIEEGQKILAKAETDQSAFGKRPTKKRKLGFHQSKSMFRGTHQSDDHEDDSDGDSVSSNDGQGLASAGHLARASSWNRTTREFQDLDWMQTATSSHAQDSTSPRTRSTYYYEFKKFPAPSREFFNHKGHLNQRLLRFRKAGYGGLAPSTWTIADLEEPAILERALEIVLRVISGSSHVELVPFPQIDFSRVPDEVLVRVMKVIAAIKEGKSNLVSIMNGEVHSSEDSKDSGEDDSADEEEDEDDDDSEEECKEDSDDAEEKEEDSDKVKDFEEDKKLLQETTISFKDEQSPTLAKIQKDETMNDELKDGVSLKEDVLVKKEDCSAESLGNYHGSANFPQEPKHEDDGKALIKQEPDIAIKTEVKTEPDTGSVPKRDSATLNYTQQGMGTRLSPYVTSPGTLSSPIDLTIDFTIDLTVESAREAPRPSSFSVQAANQREIIKIEDDDSFEVITIDSDSNIGHDDDDDIIFVSERWN